MSEVVDRRKVVRTLAKGQVTLPTEFRAALGIEPETLLDVRLVGDHLEIKPLQTGGDELRRYSDEDIARFLEEDKLDEVTAKRVRDLLKRGSL